MKYLAYRSRVPAKGYLVFFTADARPLRRSRTRKASANEPLPSLPTTTKRLSKWSGKLLGDWKGYAALPAVKLKDGVVLAVGEVDVSADKEAITDGGGGFSGAAEPANKSSRYANVI